MADVPNHNVRSTTFTGCDRRHVFENAGLQHRTLDRWKLELMSPYRESNYSSMSDGITDGEFLGMITLYSQDHSLRSSHAR